MDIHAHVLPGIDDGPKDLDASVEMAAAAAAAGTGTLATTPHLHPNFPDVHVGELAERVDGLRAAVASEGIDIRLVSGAEVSVLWAADAGDEELRLASYDQRGSDLLVETPPPGVTMLPDVVSGLRARGYRVTLAHPERSLDFQRDFTLVEGLVDQGVLLEVNADALTNPPPRSPVRRLAERICRAGLAHVLASDGHRAHSWRPVGSLAAGVEAAAALIGRDRANWMARGVPGAIVAGLELPPAPELEAKPRRRGIFSRR